MWLMASIHGGMVGGWIWGCDMWLVISTWVGAIFGWQWAMASLYVAGGKLILVWPPKMQSCEQC